MHITNVTYINHISIILYIDGCYESVKYEHSNVLIDFVIVFINNMY